MDCRYLVRLPDGKTECSVYETRLGRDLGNGFVCTMVELTTKNYPDCPFNKVGQELHPAYKESNA